MNVKTTVILLVLLVLCVAYVVLFHTGVLGPETRPAEDAGGKDLLADPGTVRRIVLAAPGEPRIVLVKRDDEWRIAEPVDAPAVGWQAESTLTTLTTLKVLQTYDPDDEDFPKDDLTHLSAPRRVVTLTNDKGETFTVRVGRRKPLAARQTYVALGDEKRVHVVDRDLAAALDESLDDYRRKTVARFDTDKAVRVEVRGEHSYQLVKVEDRWAIDRPVAARADQEEVKKLLGDISGVSADAFVDDAPKDLAAYGLDRPRLTVTVELAPPEKPEPATRPAETAPAKPQPGRAIALLLGAPADTQDKKVFAKLADRPWVFQVEAKLMEDLQPKLIDLRDKRVLDVAGREAVRIDVTLAKGGSTALVKTEGDWRMTAPFAGPADEAAVINLIALLRDDLEAEEFQDDPASFAAFGLEPPEGKIVLHFRGVERTTTLLLGRSSDSGQMGFVRVADSPSVAVVPAADFARLLRPAPAYWSKRIFKLPGKAEITRATLDGPERAFTVAVEDDGAYKLLRPAGAPPDKENVKALLEAVEDIKADKIAALGKKLPQRFAKARPIRLTVHYRTELPPAPPATAPATAPATGPATKPATAPATQPATRPARRYEPGKSPTILVAKLDEKAFAWVAGAEPVAVGEMPAAFHDKLAAEMRDRTVMTLDPDETVAFKMVVGKVSLEFKRVEDTWRYSGDTFVKVDDKKVKDFLKALSGLEARRFVDYSDKPNLRRFALNEPAMVLEATTEDGKARRLSISGKGPVGEKGLYAVSSEVPGVFVLAPEASEKMRKDLTDFQAKD